MNKTKNSIMKVKASKLKAGDMVEVDTGDDFKPRDFVKITYFYPVGKSRWNGMVDIVLDEIDEDGEERIEAFKHDEMMNVRKPLSSMTKAEHKKAIKKLQAKQDEIRQQIDAHEDALIELKRPKPGTFTVKRADKVKVGDAIDSDEFPAGFRKVWGIGGCSSLGEITFYFTDGEVLQLLDGDFVNVKKVSK